MKLLSCAILIVLLFTAKSNAGAFGSVYGPDDPELERNGLNVECTSWDGRTFFQVSLILPERLRDDDWYSEFVLWKDRVNSKVEISYTNPWSSEAKISCSFSIDDNRIDDADFRFQSSRQGTAGLYYQLDLKAFMRGAIKKTSNRPMDLTTGNAALSVASTVAAIRSGTEAARTKSSLSAFTPTDLMATAVPPVASHRGRSAQES